MRSREIQSLLVMVAFTLSLAATSKPKEGGKTQTGGNAGLSTDTAYTSIVVSTLAPPPAVTCSDAILTAAAKTVRTAESWEHPDVHDLWLIDSVVAAGMSKAAPRQNHPDDGWRWINSPTIRDLYPTSWTVTEQSESHNAERILSVAARPLFALLRADTRVLPRVTSGDNYVGGKLSGKLVIARIDTGAAVCSIPFFAESSSRVKFKERGITGTTFERATLDDFKTQVRASLASATSAVAPSFKVNVGY